MGPGRASGPSRALQGAGRRDDHGIDGAVVEQTAEIAVPLDGPPDQRRRLVEPPTVDLGDRHGTDVGLRPEVEDMTLADEPEADEPDADPVVGPEDPRIA